MRVLVTGGAGYIGSICARELVLGGADVVVWDDLSTGHREAVSGELVIGDIRDHEGLASLLRSGFDAVLHFAGKALVGESIENPELYYDVNAGGTGALVHAMVDAGTPCVVFSSTCATYGEPKRVPVDEAHVQAPTSPYGDSKLLAERLLDAGRGAGIRVCPMRYFNAVGAWPEQDLGESHAVETHLIPLAIGAALGNRPPLVVNGDDWNTEDGTCVRDYIHVRDLADAHLRALSQLHNGWRGEPVNLGAGVGTSVREVLATVERVTGLPVPHRVGPRRKGDPRELFADVSRAAGTLDWKPRRTIEDAVRDAVAWEHGRKY